MKELIEIQSELHAPKNQRNTFGKYNYRSCEDILEAVKPLLHKYECVLTISDAVKDCTTGDYIESMVIIINKDKCEVAVRAQAGIEKAGGMALPQAFGSASSYARKYALNGLFLIDDTKDADATNTHDKPPSKPAKKVTDDQMIEIAALMIELDISDEQFLKVMGKAPQKLTEPEAKKAITKLEAKRGK
jgi:hypothetical protein